MDEFRIRTRVLSPLGPPDRKTLSAFLLSLGLRLEEDIELSVLVEDQNSLIATASLAGDVIKCVGVLPEREGEGAAARAVSVIMAEAQARGQRQLFVYTKPSNKLVFESLGFSSLAEVSADYRACLPTQEAQVKAGDREGVVLMENDARAFDTWVTTIQKMLPKGRAEGVIVVNCNPFTLGHRYLIEQAAAALSSSSGPEDLGKNLPTTTLLVLVIAGDRSSFPGAVRETLVRIGTADLPNVVVASGGSYCVSGATFPSYYLKEKSRAAELQASLDATLFATRIAPALGIRRRYVGSEPYCPVTLAYNRALETILPAYGVDLITIPRLEWKGEAISASRVRLALQQGNLELATSLVPTTTAAWLRSPEAAPILERIKTGTGRH